MADAHQFKLEDLPVKADRAPFDDPQTCSIASRRSATRRKT
jgi:hypothetical protein